MKTGISGSGVFLRDSQHFLDGGDAFAGSRPAVHAQRRHAGLDGQATDLAARRAPENETADVLGDREQLVDGGSAAVPGVATLVRSEEHTSELQSQSNLVCRLLLEKKKTKPRNTQDNLHQSTLSRCCGTHCPFAHAAVG